MFIKICGTTNLEDAHLAADLGATAVGFVFAKSPRQVTAAQVAVITPTLPRQLKKIGVFHARTAQEIIHDIHAAGLNGAQLHFDYDAALVSRLRAEFGPGFFLVQTVHWVVYGHAERSEQQFRAQLVPVAADAAIDAILLDARTQTAAGGTGQSFDWTAARAVLDELAPAARIILAGGLNPANVAEAILTLRPWGVDVVTGVEFMPGMKDAHKVKAFIEAART
jgi:phosphoribosylanthranilate isomerase